MAKIHTTKTFMIEGGRVSLAAGVKNGRPVVVLGLLLTTSGTLPDALSFIAIDYPMRSVERAEAFVACADEAVARRGMSDIQEKFGDVIALLAHAFDTNRTAEPVRRINPFEAHR